MGHVRTTQRHAVIKANSRYFTLLTRLHMFSLAELARQRERVKCGPFTHNLMTYYLLFYYKLFPINTFFIYV